MNIEQKLHNEGRCCITGKSLKDSKNLNWVQLNIKAKWTFPVWGNFITGEENMAIAYVHDDCINTEGHVQGEIINAVEFKNNEIIYHPVKDLQ
ncbi:MAG: hypothetical protein ABI921_00535 [Panacibacter sp.]